MIGVNAWKNAGLINAIYTVFEKAVFYGKNTNHSHSYSINSQEVETVDSITDLGVKSNY